MNHFPPVFLKEGKNSTAYYSKNDPEKLVVFVHGFKGASVGTWNDFPSLIQAKPELINSDVLFYGYNSLKGHAFDQSQEFYRFLDKYAQQTSISLRPNKFEYKKIAIVAHSLGAVVSRYSIINAIQNNSPWKDSCRLFLFAPAHSGARIQNIVMLSLPSFFKLAGGLGLFFSPILDDLRPGSTCLNELRDKTNSYQNTRDEAILKAMVIQAKGDKIVHNNQFCYDSFLPINPIEGKSHTSICKPKDSVYLMPIEELVKLI